MGSPRTPAAVCVAVGVVAVMWAGATAFNVDVDNVVRYRGRGADDMFGFSVALHKEARSGDSWVLVGAPEAQSERQRRVVRGGAVYRCDVSNDRCDELLFDQSDGNNRNQTNHDIDNKSHQWFGATVAAAESGSAVVACAPRYVNYPNTRERRHDPVGTCWVARDEFARFNEYSPCRTSEWGYHRKGHCQAGLGASISKDGRQLFIGAPGSHYWQGQLFTVDATVFMPFLPPESIRVNSTTGQLFAENLHRKPEVYETPEGPSTDDDTYLGYSVAVGYFEGPGNTTVAVGRPRGDQLKGKVEIYSWDLVLLVDISGDQLGGYFGYSLCASDMDGDGGDDLVVGAPLFTEPNNEGKYETGRIYVLYQKDDYEGNSTRDGVHSRSRFGLSLSSLGDINKDGFGDIAVGAPYDNPEGRGAVYIYLGSKEGISEKPSQIIYAKDVSQGLSTFGFSVSGGLDLDNNQYPDLVVGAYEAGFAAFFRTRPIVKVDAQVTFLESKSSSAALKQINLKNHNCNIQRNGRNDTICLVVRSCLKFDGLGADNWHNFNVQVVLDGAKTRTPRMYFLDASQKGNSRNFTAQVAKNSGPFCRDFDIYIKPSIRDKLSPLSVEMRYNLQTYRSQRSLAPVLDLSLPPVQKDTLNIVKNCGPDNICIPDLKMKIEPSVEQYLLGSEEDFRLNVHVDNKAEDAFEASYSLKIPRGLNYTNIVRVDKNQDISVHCSPPSQATNYTLICDIGNPLPSKKYVEFNVLMKPFYTEGLRSHYRFEMEVNSTNPEKATTQKDNKKIMEIPISIQTDFSLMGASYPSDAHWGSVDYSKTEGFTEETEIGPQVVHIHKIHNKGPADIVKAEVFFIVPTSTFASDNVLYLLEEPETEGPIKCEPVYETNFLNLKLSSSNKISYFEGHERLTGSDESLIRNEESSSSHGGVSEHSQNSQGRGKSYDGTYDGGRRVSGGSSNAGEYHGHGSHRLVGADEERTIHKDEGLEGSVRGSLGEGGSDFSYQHSSSSQSFQNSSQSSRRVEAQGGGSGPKVHSSTNFSASWSENGGPVHHYENHTAEENGVQVERDEKHHNGRDHGGTRLSEAGRNSGGWVQFNSSRTHHSSSSGVSTGGSSGGAHVGSDGVNQNRSRVYSGTGTYGGNSAVHQSDNRESHHSSRDHSSGHRTAQGHDNRDENSHTGSRSYYGQTETNHNVHVGYNNNEDDYENGDYDDEDDNENNEEEDYNDENGGYRHDYRGRHYGNSQSGDRRQEDTSQGSFKHYSDNWASRGSSSSHGESRRQHHGSEHSTLRSAERDNVARDNVNADQGLSGSQFSHLDQSQGRTYQHHSGNDYSAGGASHSSDSRHGSSTSHHQSSSNWGQKTTSHSQNSNYNGGSYENDAARKYYSSNWGTSQNQDLANRNQNTNEYNSRTGIVAGTGRDQSTNEEANQEGRNGGQFYTSSVLLNGNGNADLGYAARGYGQNRDAFTSLKSRHYSSKDHVRTTVDPDLADLGAQFTESPDKRQNAENTQFRHYRRYRRSVIEGSLADLVKCNATNCTKIHCTLGPLVKEQEARVALRMRVWVPTMKKLKDNRIVKTSTRMVMQVTGLPYIGSPSEAIVRDHEVFTDIVSTDSPTLPDIVPLWVVVLSAVAGTIILLLLIFLLWKCGFFKRNRPADAAEKEPLNRNGHYSAGDEAL